MNIIVTGASRGLGAAICRILTDQGHSVLATARSEETLKELWGDNPRVEILACDIGSDGAPQKLVETALEAFGELHGLVNNAGIIQPILPLADCPPDDWAKTIHINLVAPAALMAAALPHLQKTRGRVVNISSGAAINVLQGWSAYCTSKAGLLHLTKGAAAEYPEVAFFSLRPGVIDTEMQTEIRDSKGMTEKDLAKFQGLKADKKLEPPEVPGRAAAWLVLHGPLERSGEFLQYTEELIKNGVEAQFRCT